VPVGQVTQTGLVPTNAAPEHVPSSCCPTPQPAGVRHAAHWKLDVLVGSAVVYCVEEQNCAVLQKCFPACAA
jgi:hypothetical protein